MFTEIHHVKQERRGPGRRRWFEADDCELVVWLDANDGLSGFQLCYDWGQGERALTWRAGSGFAHSAVDQGDATPLKNESPVLMPDGKVPWSEIARRFDAHAASLEPPLHHFIHDKLAEQVSASAD